MAALIEGPHHVRVASEALEIDGTHVDIIAAAPDDAPARGTVVVIPDIMGVRPLFEDLCRRLATHGLSVCAFEPFAHIPDHERAQLDVQARMSRVCELHDDWILEYASGAADFAELDAQTGTTSVIGFCMGGYFCFKAAASTRFANAVPFYGMVRTPAAWRGEYLSELLDTIADTCPTLAIFGGKDTYTPPEDIAALRDAFRGLPGHEIVVYPEAEHGFVHDPSRPSHRADDAADAWHRTLAFCGVG